MDRLTIRIIRNTLEEGLGVETGEIDMMLSFQDLNELNHLRSQEHMTVVKNGSKGVGPIYWLAFNLQKKPFDDIRVRKALAYAIDRRFIVETLFQGEAALETGPISSNSPFYSSDVNTYARDVEKANRLLDEAGYPRDRMGKRFSFRITYIPEKTGSSRKIVEYLVRVFLNDLGVETVIEHPENFKDWKQKVSSWNFDATMDDVYNWGDPVIGVHRTYLSSNIRKGVIWSNTQRYRNPEVDALLEEAGSELDFEKRRAFYRKFQRIITDEVPVYSMLSKEMEGLISDGSMLVLTKNPLILESLSLELAADHQRIQQLIFLLKGVDSAEAAVLSQKSNRIFEDLRDLVNLKKKEIHINERILQLSLHIRRTWESVNVEDNLDKSASIDHLRELFGKTFRLLMDVPTLADGQRLEEYQTQIFELKEKLEVSLQRTEQSLTRFKRYLNILARYGVGKQGLRAMAKQNLEQKTLIQARLAQIAFLSDELVGQTDKVFSKISTKMERQSRKVTREIEWLGKLFLAIPAVIVMSAILIFLFIRRSVIGRILNLEKVMKAHVEGNPLPIHSRGDDEIAGMARSLAYFVRKRDDDEKNLREARQAAETANQAKSDFLANMSHELRTPLNAVLGFSQVLSRSGSLSSRDMEALNTIHRSGEHLLTLINQILDLSTIEAGRLALNEVDFDLFGLLREVEGMFRIHAAQQQLRFSFELEQGIPRFIRSDPVKLRQVLINLLNNAFKFEERKISRSAMSNLASPSHFHGYANAGDGWL